jgi:F0F1-type ATP synthase membrane subunit c/vacuolar-type H+-ATPase subunit K
MDEELKQKLAEQDATLEAIYRSAEKTRKYFLFVIWASIIVVVLPLIGLVFAIPKFLSVYLGAFGGL